MLISDFGIVAYLETKSETGLVVEEMEGSVSVAFVPARRGGRATYGRTKESKRGKISRERRWRCGSQT